MVASLVVIGLLSVAVAGSVAWRAKQTLIDDAQSGTRGYF
ncbi:hypothetical protein BGCPKDLD_4223 [Methylorubrum suomiense]|jgi:hypothetical protein|uniref:Uncharacterized protein n=1 Tax=Methylorubrum suomiense TaxID=144191 RepID=A0ABQ4UZK5_9HYPH|nr:hypothetical protein BGCPKDLD_4223 [Methylorubrum suomiense]